MLPIPIDSLQLPVYLLISISCHLHIIISKSNKNLYAFIIPDKSFLCLSDSWEADTNHGSSLIAPFDFRRFANSTSPNIHCFLWNSTPVIKNRTMRRSLIYVVNPSLYVYTSKKLIDHSMLNMKSWYLPCFSLNITD